MNDRTIIIENVSKQSIGLVDTQNRAYNLKATQRVRLSKYTVQDILDVPGSKKIFDLGLAKIKNSNKAELLSLGLTEDEVIKYADVEEVSAPVVIITDSIEVEPTEVKEDKELPNSSEETIIIVKPTVENKPKKQTSSSDKQKSASKKSTK